MVCAKVIGNHTGITIAGSDGHFELNVFKPLIAYNILQSIDIMSDSVKNFGIYCVKGIKANKKKNQRTSREFFNASDCLSTKNRLR